MCYRNLCYIPIFGHSKVSLSISLSIKVSIYLQVRNFLQYFQLNIQSYLIFFALNELCKKKVLYQNSILIIFFNKKNLQFFFIFITNIFFTCGKYIHVKYIDVKFLSKLQPNSIRKKSVLVFLKISTNYIRMAFRDTHVRGCDVALSAFYTSINIIQLKYLLFLS